MGKLRKKGDIQKKLRKSRLSGKRQILSWQTPSVEERRKETGADLEETKANRVEIEASLVEMEANLEKTEADRAETEANRVETEANRVETEASLDAKAKKRMAGERAAGRDE